jgi:23S rRNA (cytosine1962-C5)-methyltransferase
MKSAVDWARDNAKLSNLQSLPIRWIVEDARVYVSREIKRGRRYDLIVLDPPSYGHGPRGKAWEIHRDLLPLLSECWYLLSDTPIGVLMCGHSPDVDIKLLHSALARKFGREKPSTCEVSQAKLIDRSGRSLDCGYSAKFSFNR